MKKIFLIFIALVTLLTFTILYRAQYYYSDQQLYPKLKVDRVSVDRQKVTNHLSRAIQIPTISKDGAPFVNSEKFFEFHQFLEKSFPMIYQFANKTTINQHSLIFEFPGSDTELKPYLFMGHMDVVPVDDDTLDQWFQPPFSGKIFDNQIWGRGALDDKATVLALMEAMELQLTKGRKPKRTIYFSFGHDEEIGGKNGAAKIAEYFKSKNIIFDMVLDEGGVIVDRIVAGFEQPIAMVGVAEKGFVNIRLSVNAEGGHSSMPPNHTAAGILAQAIVKLEDSQFPASLQFTNLIFDSIGHYAQFDLKLAMANQWLLSPLVKSKLLSTPQNAAALRTSIAVTQLKGSSKSNILPTQASAVVNFRIFPGQTWESVLAYVTNAIDDPRVKLEAFMGNNPSPISSSDNKEFKMIEQTIREFEPDTLVTPYLVQGGTDAKHFYELSDSVYRFLMIKLTPETLNSFHGINERINVDDYVMSIQFFYELLNKASFEPA